MYTNSDDSLVERVEDQLLRLLQDEYAKKQQISDELLSSLNFVFGNPLLPALDLVDHSNITKFSSPSGRVAFQVKGTTGHLYALLPSSQFCSCPYHEFGVLKRKEAPMCKHALAVLISCAVGTCKEASLSDEHLAQLLLTNTDTAVDET
ncbi:hypothetical protein BSL78_01732 [Apostichopus japonicus]|uniref:SWIM-type domain-containing protein n=1 Tax=Stichopus japonicus TaxID=307972 RepID=A0A2G8LM77_STIJA|nr:hypothetical protein BSL78_01732 [Apostichopus japonicus]